ncbi:MAG: hypothetical protein ABW175_04465 [Bradyrhizobium sp.]
MTRRLLETSVDLQNLLAEVSALREAVRVAEVAKLNQVVVHPAAFAQPATIELRA